MKITPIYFNKININFASTVLKPNIGGDCCAFENSFIDKKPLIKRGIISENRDINDFFDEISSQIFNGKKSAQFSSLLKSGAVSLSSSCYFNLKNPKSAMAFVLNPSKTTIYNISRLIEPVNNGIGVGINFSSFSNPVDEIKKINAYFKYKEKQTLRPPAGIGLLNINHPEILEFINIKKEKDYENWCFDFSVVIDDEFFKKLDNGDKKAMEIYSQLKTSMLKTGEPGIIFSNKKDYICDSCASCELNENEGLVLGQINLAKFINENSFDYKKLIYASKILKQAMEKIDSNYRIGILGYQDLLDKLGMKYGSNEANILLQKILSEIKKQDIKIAISPTGTISRLLKTTPSIEPKNQNLTYYQEIDTLSCAQKIIGNDGQISKTILLKKDYDETDIDNIIRYSKKMGLKGISVFNPN